jgi:2'-5' RNA ligase
MEDLVSDMSDNKFLTVMAVFDDKTQKLLGGIQQSIIDKAGEGTQTMGIPFHITLGSYPTSLKDEVVEKIRSVVSLTRTFPIKLLRYNSFGDAVLFLEPNVTDELIALRKQFECDYANGFEWVPHATLFCGEDARVRQAKTHTPSLDFPIEASIVAIELGEFFPPKKIIRVNFEK